MNKYHAKKTEIDGLVFDSKKEAEYYSLLKMQERMGRISGLKLQYRYQIINSAIDHKGKKLPPIYYIADFVYWDSDAKLHVVDVKGFKTPVYKLKKRLMLELYDIDIEEV